MTTPIFSVDALNELSLEAQASLRLRKNFNMHPHLESSVQRLFNAMEPGTYVRPHRHARLNGWEMMLAVRGHFDILVFDEKGQLTQRHSMGTSREIMAIELPAFTWHSVVSLEKGTIMFEVKEGPYVPVKSVDFAPWSPSEDDPSSVDAFLQWAEKAQPGDVPPPFEPCI